MVQRCRLLSATGKNNKKYNWHMIKLDSHPQIKLDSEFSEIPVVRIMPD
jgi:hypothetical protein